MSDVPGPRTARMQLSAWPLSSCIVKLRKIHMTRFSVLIIVCLVSINAFAAPTARIVNVGNDSALEYCGIFKEDDLNLIISDSGKDIASYRFCSSYGGAEVQIIRDKRNVDYVLLRHKEGRGTNATTEYLSVFRPDMSKPHGDLVELMRVPISAGANMTSRWHYDYKVYRPKMGGIKFVLTRRIDKIGDEELVYLPLERLRVIHVNTH